MDGNPVSEKTPMTIGVAKLIFGGCIAGIVASFGIWMDISNKWTANSVKLENVARRLDTHEAILGKIQADITDIRVSLASSHPEDK